MQVSSVIRFAELNDLDEIVELQKKIFNDIELGKHYDFVEEDVRATVECLIQNKQAIVAEHKGEVVGCIGFTLEPSLFNFSVFIATEIGWSVKKGYSATAGMALLRACMRQAKRAGAKKFRAAVPENVPRLSRIYRNMGFSHLDDYYLKEL